MPKIPTSWCAKPPGDAPLLPSRDLQSTPLSPFLTTPGLAKLGLAGGGLEGRHRDVL